jgi:glycosyltransferase involved in cell wall biosynthesis
MKNIVHVLVSDYRVDSRVTNETVSLVKEGYDVTVYCLKSSKLSSDEKLNGVHIKRFGIVSNRVINLISAFLVMIFFALKSKVHCVHAHDVSALPVAFMISKLKRVPLIYDSHELWGESLHAFDSKTVIKLVVFVEKILARQASVIITVSKSIKTHLSSVFNISHATVIRNIPSYTYKDNYDLFRETYNINKDSKILIYQGLIDISRGVDLIVDAAIHVCKSNEKCFFFILGDGPHIDELKEKVNKFNLTNRIIFFGYVKQSDLLKYTRSADIGIHAIKNSCLNHSYCLPNKLFEYINSGLVLVVTDLIELGSFVRKKEVGVTFDDGNLKSLEQAILLLLKDQTLFDKCRINSSLASQKYTWDNEFIKLKEIYEKIC